MFSWRDDPSFDRVYRTSTDLASDRDRWCPSVDTYEIEPGLVLLVELAGVSREDIQLVVQERILILTGYRTDPTSDAKIRLHQMEIDYGAFERHINLPDGVDVDRIAATFRDGFLRVEMPRLTSQRDGNIRIQTG